jgi:hypothetical protein
VISLHPSASEVRRVRLSLAAGAVFAAGLVAVLLFGAPPPTFAGTASGFGCDGCIPPIISGSYHQFSAGARVSLCWNSINGTVIFLVSGPQGLDVLSQEGTSGCGSFLSVGGTYSFEVEPGFHQFGYLYAHYAGTY